jgi:hypothetical protein
MTNELNKGIKIAAAPSKIITSPTQKKRFLVLINRAIDWSSIGALTGEGIKRLLALWLRAGARVRITAFAPDQWAAS